MRFCHGDAFLVETILSVFLLLLLQWLSACYGVAGLRAGSDGDLECGSVSFFSRVSLVRQRYWFFSGFSPRGPDRLDVADFCVG